MKLDGILLSIKDSQTHSDYTNLVEIIIDKIEHLLTFSTLSSISFHSNGICIKVYTSLAPHTPGHGYIIFLSNDDGLRDGYLGTFRGALIATKIYLSPSYDLSFFCDQLKETIQLIFNQEVH